MSLAKRIASIPGEFVLRHELSKSVISEVFLCRFNNLNAVIKLDSLCAARLAVDRQNEFMLLKHIQHLDIAPKALYADSSNGISIWEYVQGKEGVGTDPFYRLLVIFVALINRVSVKRRIRAMKNKTVKRRVLMSLLGNTLVCFDPRNISGVLDQLLSFASNDRSFL